jgi:hypothetical protein
VRHQQCSKSAAGRNCSRKHWSAVGTCKGRKLVGSTRKNFVFPTGMPTCHFRPIAEPLPTRFRHARSEACTSQQKVGTWSDKRRKSRLFRDEFIRQQNSKTSQNASHQKHCHGVTSSGNRIQRLVKTQVTRSTAAVSLHQTTEFEDSHNTSQQQHCRGVTLSGNRTQRLVKTQVTRSTTTVRPHQATEFKD